MDEHEPPRERVPILHLAEDRLRAEDDEEERPQAQQARVARSESPQEPADEKHADPEDRGDADVHVDRVRDLEAESLDLLAGPGMRARGGRDSAGDDERGADGEAEPRHDPPEPARAGGRGEPGDEAPGLDDDDRREPENGQPEQEVRHHRQRVQVDRDRDAAHRDLGDGDEERAQRSPAADPREPGDLARGQPRREREQDPDEGDHAIAELDKRVVPLLGVRPIAAAGPVLAPEPRPRQSDERARGHHEEDGDARRRREPEEARRVELSGRG